MLNKYLVYLKMSRQSELLSEEVFLLRHPFTCLIAGPSGSGKTVLTRNLIQEYLKTTTIKKPSVNVLWVHGQQQAIYKKPFQNNVNIEYLESLPSNSQITDFKTDFIVVDDLMTELGDSKRLSEMFTKLSHHLNFSIIFIVQNLFYKSKEMRNISTNAHYVFLMKNRRDVKQIEYFARQAYSQNSKEFMKVYMKATKEPFSYLLVDNKQETPEAYRLRLELLSEYPAVFEEQ
jgi:Cdc6-like AAA superfamily ATPase